MDGRNRRKSRLGPSRYSRGQLGRVWQHGQPRSYTQDFTELIANDDVDGSCKHRLAREVLVAVGALVDDQFRACCRLDDVNGGTVRILVEQPELLYHIRAKWQSVLLSELRQMGRRGAVQRVTFQAVEGYDADHPDKAGCAFPSSRPAR
jgi:hypothetical protein